MGIGLVYMDGEGPYRQSKDYSGGELNEYLSQKVRPIADGCYLE